ncbi:MAG: hypothetical protein ACK4SZ_07245 [Allosphingosinicella sp.]|uniref:hypothetical protein n=1 Tax=Allosphingosinicella sp. TaxID=2823234 RepID=UPI0039269AF8
MTDSKQPSGEVEGAMASGGESQGGENPGARKEKKPAFSGGQTEKGYHGTGQLGDDKVGDGNQNAPAKSESK